MPLRVPLTSRAATGRSRSKVPTRASRAPADKSILDGDILQLAGPGAVGAIQLLAHLHEPWTCRPRFLSGRRAAAVHAEEFGTALLVALPCLSGG